MRVTAIVLSESAFMVISEPVANGCQKLLACRVATAARTLDPQVLTFVIVGQNGLEKVIQLPVVISKLAVDFSDPNRLCVRISQRRALVGPEQNCTPGD